MNMRGYALREVVSFAFDVRVGDKSRLYAVGIFGGIPVDTNHYKTPPI